MFVRRTSHGVPSLRDWSNLQLTGTKALFQGPGTGAYVDLIWQRPTHEEECCNDPLCDYKVDPRCCMSCDCNTQRAAAARRATIIVHEFWNELTEAEKRLAAQGLVDVPGDPATSWASPLSNTQTWIKMVRPVQEVLLEEKREADRIAENERLRLLRLKRFT